MKKKILYTFVSFMFLFAYVFVLASCKKKTNDTKKQTTTKGSTTTSQVEKVVVEFDPDGGSNIDNQEVNKGSKITKPNDPTKTGYTFNGWYYENSLVSFDDFTVTSNITLKAKWTINSYTLTLDIDNDKAGTISLGDTYEYCANVTITAQTNKGYTFSGWYEGETLISPDETFTFLMPASNLAYTAKWEANTDTTYKVEHYLQNLDDTYPETPEDIDELTGTTDTLTNGEAKTYNGFTSPTVTQENISGDGETTLKLYYTRDTYTISLYKNNNDAGSVSGSNIYKFGSFVTLEAETNEGYTFVGWYDGDDCVSENATFKFNMVASDLEFTATWIPKKYIITLDNKVDGLTISGITSGSEYDCGSEITLTATGHPLNYVIKWVRNDEVTYWGDTYTFNVPAHNLTITITMPYARVDNKIYFGTYPQTLVTDDTLKGELDTLAGNLPTSENTYNWTDCNYYIESEVVSYMFYIDIDYDEDGTYDYRGVYFTQYRPWNCAYESSTDNSFQDNNGYETNTVYWFRYDPIEWEIITESDGKALIISKLILDSQDYNTIPGASEYEHNGGVGYANNYALSNIRKFLNENFYNMAFNDLQKSIIELTEVDNSVESTGQSSNPYVCNNTKDYIFLLSYAEASNLENRLAKGTDYAKSQGLFIGDIGCSAWFLRSPYYDSFGYSYKVNYNENVIPVINKGTSCSTHYGVRPACWIEL